MSDPHKEARSGDGGDAERAANQDADGDRFASQSSEGSGPLLERCAPGTPAGEAALLADKYATLNAPVPSSLLDTIVHTECQDDGEAVDGG